MKTYRCPLVWIPLALCGVLVVGAMAWLTRGVLASERERASAEARADLEECTRLALWRMDAAGAAIVSAENGHPATDYHSAPSSLDDTENPLAKLHFELREDGRLTSPGPGDHREKLAELKSLLGKNPVRGGEWSLLSRAAEAGESAWNAVPKEAGDPYRNIVSQREASPRSDNRVDETYQMNFNGAEKTQRARSVDEVMTKSLGKVPAPVRKMEAAPAASKAVAAEEPVRDPFAESPPTVKDTSAMRGIWIGGELFLLRQFSLVVAGKVVNGVQGVWLDQALLKQRLLGDVKDLLPQADLVPSPEVTQDPLALVSVPFKLLRNESPVVPRVGLNGALTLGWAAVLLALATTALLVRGIMRLSERRASFVSAVTHELRTPLTTFRLYSDMLEGGVVREEKRGDYLRVLSREADRLSHLVENVLSFSRIERGSARAAVKDSTVGELLEASRERLEARLATSGLALTMNLQPPVSARRVHVDSASVEHILFNLVDNAAKYAASGIPAVVDIGVRDAGRHLEIRVSDHGPGIPRGERKRIFRAFHKSAREAAESQPGVGLGLALSRRLAKSLGGSLDCESPEKGACFVLRLPFA